MRTGTADMQYDEPVFIPAKRKGIDIHGNDGYSRQKIARLKFEGG